MAIRYIGHLQSVLASSSTASSPSPTATTASQLIHSSSHNLESFYSNSNPDTSFTKLWKLTVS